VIKLPVATEVKTVPFGAEKRGNIAVAGLLSQPVGEINRRECGEVYRDGGNRQTDFAKCARLVDTCGGYLLEAAGYYLGCPLVVTWTSDEFPFRTVWRKIKAV